MKPSSSAKPLVASICGTFLKPEMQSVYRQITGLRRHRTIVLTERHVHADQFPFEPVVVMDKRPAAVRSKSRKQRPRGNFIRRFYYKHLLKTRPPPEKPRSTPILAPPPPADDEAYNLADLLRQHGPRLAHVYYGHKAVKFLPMLQRWGGPWLVSFHGLDVTAEAYRPGDSAKLTDVFAHAQLVLGRSQSLLARLAELGCPREKLRLNRTSIPLEHLAPAVRHAPSDGRWIFLQACRLIPKKGLTTTLAAMREIVRVQPRARLIVAGSGPLLEELRTLADELGLTPAQVEFAGWCSQEHLAKLYTQAHIFVHPSELTETGDQEGIPNALLEAMATGLPAVATRHGGIPEAVFDGMDGLLVPEKSPALLAAAILRIASNNQLLGAMSAAAAAAVARNFGAERQLRALEDCYEEACAGMP